MAFDERISVTMQLVDRTSAALDNIGKRLLHVRSNFDNLNRTARDHVVAQNKNKKAIQETSFSIQDLIAQLGALAVAYKTVQLAQSAIKSSDQLVTSTARLSIISNTPNDMLQQVYQMSQEVRSDFMEMSGTVAKMGINVGVGEGQWFSNTDQLIRFNELLAKTFKTGGQNNKEIAAGMLQLTQAMSSGRLQGDEFRSMFENAPLYISYIGEYMAAVDGHMDQFGNTIAYTAGELKQLAAEGKITTDIMINAMMTGADKIEAQFEKLPVTIEDRWTQTVNMLKNQAKALFNAMNDAVNTEAFVMFLDQLSDQLTVILGIVTDVLKILSPAINLALATWKLWTPFAALLAGLFGLIAVKAVLAEMGITKTTMAMKLQRYESLMIADASRAAANATGFLRIQTIMLTDALHRNNSVSAKTYIYAHSAMTAMRLRGIVLKSETAMWVANTSAMILNTLATKSNIVASAVSRVFGAARVGTLTAQTFATVLLAKATYMLNAALTYLTLPLMVGMGILWAVLKVINKLTGSSYTLSGVLMGVVNLAITAVTNALIDMYNAGVAVYNLLFSKKKAYIQRHSYTVAWKEGLNYGNIGAMDYTATGNELAGIKGNTDKIVDNTSTSAEEMKFLRQMAEDRVASRLSNVNVSIVNNNDMKVSSDYDIDGIVTKITVGLEEALNSGASGVHT